MEKIRLTCARQQRLAKMWEAVFLALKPLSMKRTTTSYGATIFEFLLVIQSVDRLESTLQRRTSAKNRRVSFSAV